MVYDQPTSGNHRRIEELWERYAAGDEPFPDEAPEGIRPEIFESWRRSKNLKISPFEVVNTILDDSDLKKMLADNEVLVRTAHSYLENLYKFVSGSDFVIALTERAGYVLDIVGLQGMIGERAKKSALVIGCSRSEAYAGTCGIGVCLALGEPIQIWGAEHYIKPHHNYVCSAAPIRNEDGYIIACIDVIGPVDNVTVHTLAMTCAAADGIEKELKMRRAYDEIHVLNDKLMSTLQTLSQGIVMIDEGGVITQSNSSACNVLKLPDSDINGANIRDLLDLTSATYDIFSVSRKSLHKEMRVTNAIGIPLHLSVSSSILKDEGGKKISTVLVLEKRTSFNKAVTKVSGFTAKYSFDEIIGSSESINEIKQLGMLAAHSNSNVLILGESGTGKELLAQSIHNASARPYAPFIAINCGSLPRSLVESELFGYEAGAFTGSNKDGYPGKFELADGGTLFLDEIGDMPIDIQATLLRAIQTKEILRIGGKMPKHVDVRIIAATNVNLAEYIESKRFRKDLYYRLNVLTFCMPPLRHRRGDIELLLKRFIDEYNRRMGLNVKGFTPTAMRYIMEFDWPGNVRELENMVERAMNLASGDYLTERELGPEILMNNMVFDVNHHPAGQSYESEHAPAIHSYPPPYFASPSRSSEVLTDNVEEGMIRKALSAVRGNVTKAANIAGIPKRTMYRRIEQYSIDLSEFRA
ncbi:MAG: sigma 54-interacting transcriptional regulator [Clostridiales Family XIII bacterium]|jgi:transcriptional regulator with PAS, ATPase and Fis domain|nr:sigma 54-interacting transcriptional regulator [Clostridiales Family XIII bacterium]